MDKLKRTASILDIIFKFTYRLTIAVNIFACLAVVLFLYLCFGAPTLFAEVTDQLVTKLDFGGIAFQLNPAVSGASGAGSIYFLSSLIIGTLELLLFVLIIRSIRAILAPMKEGLPFSAEVSRSFRRLGILALCSGILTLAAQFFIMGSLIRTYDFSDLFLSEKVTQVTTYYDFDFTFVITALILFGLSYIFYYGAELQQLSDETL